MPKSARIDLRVTETMRDAIDAARGDVPRNVWIERAIEAALPRREPAVPARNVPGFNRVRSLER